MSIPLPSRVPNGRRALVSVVVLALGTMAGSLAVDLILPAVPMLRTSLGGTTTLAQFVLAAFVAGGATGVLAFGWLADHIDRRLIFTWSLAAFAGISLASAAVGDMETLVGLRFLQGAAASGPLVVAPGMIRSLFDDAGTVRVMGFFGSLQSLVPGLAPIAGAWLAAAFGWPATFLATAVIAAVTFALVAASPGLLPPGRSGGGHRKGTYRELLVRPLYLRYALSNALTLGGLVTFVFAAPVIIVDSMDGTIAGFVALQAIGVAVFVVFANISGWAMARLGSERQIRLGTAMALFCGVGFVGLALGGATDPAALIPFWLFMNAGWGLAGPPGYVAAIAAAGTNDARAAALLGLLQGGVMASGTAAVAPFLGFGLMAGALAIVVITLPALILLFMVPVPQLAGSR